ncbi:hypothetical protein FACS189483_06690 [Spirochaetia bacterium]|nr:hypothetical protein FACS189483_06690 [Spirochaetia bacterium]
MHTYLYMIDNRFKPVLVQTMKSDTLVSLEFFSTLKHFYDKYSSQLTYKDYHSFRSSLAHLYHRYNTITLNNHDGQIMVGKAEWLFEEEVSVEDAKKLKSLGFWQ